MRPSFGLLGRILLILLLTVAIEFGVSTFLYERAGRFSIREDEAHRLAEHLVIAQKMLAERGPDDRLDMARELTTDRYQVFWDHSLPAPARLLSPELGQMKRQITSWEPALAKADLRLQLISPGRKATVNGALRLPDGSWIHFRAKDLVQSWDLAVGRIIITFVPAIALLVLGALLIRRTLSPLRNLAKATERIGTDEPAHIEEAGTEEVRHLIRSFNAMHDRIHRLISERTESLAAVGHDLRTPLARLQLRIDSVDGEAREAMHADVAEMEAMVGSLLAYLGGDKEPESPARVDLAALLQTIVDDATDSGGDVEYVGPDNLLISCRRSGMRRAISNLLDNALHYGGRATLRLERGGQDIIIAIEDDGPGIAPDRLEEALRPFTRLDAERGRNTRGLGLGLAIVTRLVEADGGRLCLSNREEGGLRAAIHLPAAVEISRQQ